MSQLSVIQSDLNRLKKDMAALKSLRPIVTTVENIVVLENGIMKFATKEQLANFLRIANKSLVITSTSYTTSTTINMSITSGYVITAQAGALLFNNPTGAPEQGQALWIRIKDNGTARALTYGTMFRASSDLALPTTTIISKTLYMGFIYNATDDKLDLVSVLNNF